MSRSASANGFRWFLNHPRNMRESLACENCHGPGQKHVEAGGGKGVGGLITFAKNDPTPVERRNETCTSCHNRGPGDARNYTAHIVGLTLAYHFK